LNVLKDITIRTQHTDMRSSDQSVEFWLWFCKFNLGRTFKFLGDEAQVHSVSFNINSLLNHTILLLLFFIFIKLGNLVTVTHPSNW